MKKYLLEITTFIAGAIGMIIELVASRILSPYLGNSNLIWTCIIGMMLAFMSLGYFIGGKISDKLPKRNLLSLFLLNSAIFISLIPMIEIYVIEPISKTNLNLSLIAIICSTVTFGIPSMFLATASPFAVKLKDKDMEEIGQVSGRMSALSTIGSIFGTFIAGFVLIPKLGVKNIILLVVIILAVLSYLIYEDKDIKYTIKSIATLVVLIAIVFAGKQLFFQKNEDLVLDTDSEYSRIWIKKFTNNFGKEYTTLEVDKGYESIASGQKDLTSDYLKYYDLFDYYQENAENVLMIGGAAYSYPSYFLEKYKDKKIDVVEIDPKMTQLAEKYFNLDTQNDRLKIYHEDGRRYINTTQSKYDCILIDAFKGLNVPFQLTTEEALTSAKNSLNENGIVITNLISALDGKNANFINHEYATYKKVFGNVKIFKVQNGMFNDDELQNLILVGFKNNVNEISNKYEQYQNLLTNEIVDFSSNSQVVTDDLCQVGI